MWINLCRFLLAGVFIFSGFVKVNDPYGFAYKIQDYLEAWGLLQITPQFAPYIGSMAMGILEFTLGVYLLFGIHRKAVCTLFFLLMAFMTPLTLWLAIANPISDCGCFGDAVILTNWETFGKNVVLLIAAITVFRWRGTGRRWIGSSRFIRWSSPCSSPFIACANCLFSISALII